MNGHSTASSTVANASEFSIRGCSMFRCEGSRFFFFFLRGTRKSQYESSDEHVTVLTAHGK